MNTPTQTAALSALDAFITAITAPLIARIEQLENDHDLTAHNNDKSDDRIAAIVEEKVNDEMSMGNFKSRVEEIIGDYDAEDMIKDIVRNMTFSVSVSDY